MDTANVEAVARMIFEIIKKKKKKKNFMVNWYTQYIGVLQLTYLRDQDVLFYFTIFECLLLDY